MLNPARLQPDAPQNSVSTLSLFRKKSVPAVRTSTQAWRHEPTWQPPWVTYSAPTGPLQQVSAALHADRHCAMTDVDCATTVASNNSSAIASTTKLESFGIALRSSEHRENAREAR